MKPTKTLLYSNRAIADLDRAISLAPRESVAHLLSFLAPEGRIAAPPSEAQDAPFILCGMPTSYVIDPRGRVVGYITGEVDWTSPDGGALLRHYSKAR